MRSGGRDRGKERERARMFPTTAQLLYSSFSEEDVGAGWRGRPAARTPKTTSDKLKTSQIKFSCTFRGSPLFGPRMDSRLHIGPVVPTPDPTGSVPWNISSIDPHRLMEVSPVAPAVSVRICFLFAAELSATAICVIGELLCASEMRIRF